MFAGSMTKPPCVGRSQASAWRIENFSIDTVNDAGVRGNGRVLTPTPSSEMSVIFEAQAPQSQKSSIRRPVAASGRTLSAVEGALSSNLNSLPSRK